uniref:Uncharacterized protein n=1 Tax=Medicago truncatula TaxID=3880 RepID=A2Q303_MEDTR|nr:hypothetical protein MtrDRAFT_AC153128g28v2 [Medicago truncatula]
MENYKIHLLVLSHVYLMPQLKQRCIVGLAQLMDTGKWECGGHVAFEEALQCTISLH